MNLTCSIPADTVARIHVTGGPYPYSVALARPPMAATPEALVARGAVSCVLTHDAGLSIPDRRGQELMAATLEGGGGCLLSFVRLADAMAAAKRLEATKGGESRGALQP